MTSGARRRGCALLAGACLLAGRFAHATVELDIRGVNDELRNNVVAYLSLSRYKDRDLDDQTMERLQNRVEREVGEALKPFGYYGPHVKSAATLRQKGSWRLQIDIDPGKPVIVTEVEVKVTGPGAEDPRFKRIVDRPAIVRGEPLRHAAYELTKNDLLRVAANFGYLDARLTRNALTVDPANLSATAVLEMESGERYRFGKTTIEQNVVRDSLVRRYLRYQENEPFDLGDLQRTLFALDDSQYFSTVTLEPGEPDRTQHLVSISIKAERNRRDRYSFSGGYGTDTGPRGTVQWDRRWINSKGDRFSTQLQASARLQLLQSYYTIPVGDPATEKLAFGATADYGTPGDLLYKDFSVGIGLTRVLGRFQYVFALSPTRAYTDDGNSHRYDDLLVPSVTIGSVPRGYLGEALFGQGFVAQVRAGVDIAGGNDKFAQLHITAQHNFRISTNWHFLLRGEFGASLVSNLSELPGSMRFFAGGEGSVRGFGYDDLSPVIPKLVPCGTPTASLPCTSQGQLVPEVGPDGRAVLLKVGGRYVITGAGEIVRDLPRNLAIAVFSDVGNAFDVFGHSPNPAYPHFLEYSAGIGLRWRLPGVTLGIDVAKPISRPGTTPRIDLNFSPVL